MTKAGFSRVDVTPPLGSYLAGYFSDRFAKGILDPIELNAIAVSDGENTVLVIASDFLGIAKPYCDAIAKRITEKTGIPEGCIMLSSLHQHTSIVLRTMTPHTLNDTAYMDFLYRKFTDVAVMAIDDMKDAELFYAEEETAEPIAFIRRYYMKDGSVATNPGKRLDEIVRPCDNADNTVRLLRFKREGANDIAFVNFNTHPDVIGGELLSADWPGFVRRFVEKEHEGVSCMLLNGVQGDSNHVDFIGRAQGKGPITDKYGHSAYMGRTIADTVSKIWDKVTAFSTDSVSGGKTVVLNKTRTDGFEEYDTAKKLLDDHFAKTSKIQLSVAELGRLRRIVNLRTDPIFRQVPVTVLKIGGIAVVGFGGEPFTHYATAVREAYPELKVIASCCANGFEGYLPTRAALEEGGGYETNTSPYSPDIEESCVAAATKIISELWEK